MRNIGSVSILMRREKVKILNIRNNEIQCNCNYNKRIKFEERGYIWIGKIKNKSKIRWNILENEGMVHAEIAFHSAKDVEDKRKSEIWNMRWLQARATTARRVIQYTIELDRESDHF